VQRYTYAVTPYAIQPVITANGYGLDPVLTNVTFCVGQQIAFNFGFVYTQSRFPSYVSSTNALCNWTLPDKFVNVAITNYMHSLGTNAADCVYYTNNPSLLTTTNSPCTCWYINGTGGAVSMNSSLYFNGKTVSVAAIGQIGIYRPSTTNFVQFLNDVRWSFPYLAADMSWKESLVSTINGQFGITQLLLGTGIYFDTGGVYALDGNTTIYGENGNNAAQPYDVNNIGSHIVQFLDTPQAPALSLNLTFKNYLVFQPSGNNSIFVTIATNGWYVNASYSLISDVTTPTNLAPASSPANSDEFPIWTIYHPE